MALTRIGLAWGCAMVISNVALMPLNRTIYGTTLLMGGIEQRFQRPFFIEFVMFVAMAACLLIEIPAWRRRLHSPSFWPSRHVCLKLLMPALCDLFGSWFIFGGALWLDASIVEMLACTNIVYTAVFSVCFLKKSIARHEWVGIASNVLGVVVVGVAQLARASSGKAGKEAQNMGLTIFGLFMVVMAHFWYSIEFVITEKFLGEHEISAFISVGVMGIWGALLFVALFPLLQLTPSAPAAYAPLWHDEVGTSLAALLQSPGLLAAVVALFLSLVVFNAAAFATTMHLSAMTRVVLGSLVSPLVWALDLALSTTGGDTGAAEQLSLCSILQLLGFAFILAGTLTYNDIGPCARLANSREAISELATGSVSLVGVSSDPT